MRDLDYIPALNKAGEEKFIEAKRLIKGESEEKKKNYIEQEIDKKVRQGINEESAKKMIVSRMEDKRVYPNDTFFDNDNIEIKIEEILMNSEKYNKKYIRDLLEPEKGASKAIINCSDNSINPSIYSFLHGGITYVIDITYDFIIKYIEEKIHPKDTETDKANIERIKNFCRLANLSKQEIKKVAMKLKQKGILDSIPEFQVKKKNKINFEFRYEDGSPMPVRDNLETLLAHYNILLEYDEILKTPRMGIDDFEKKTDNRINSIIAEIKSLCVKNYLNARVVKDYLSAIIDQKSFNPMLDMIKSKKWDGKDRLKHVIDSIFSPDKEEYKREVITRWLIQCVAAWDRAENSPYPNVLPRFENVLTLVGAQGINKTKFFELLMPKELKEYVGTGIHLDPTNKDSIHLAIGKAITELGELDSTFKKDIALIKAFLSLSIDKYRRPYAQTESEFARRTSFCASVNDIEFLVDPTGNRRFWPLLITLINFATYQQIDKQQLWAQVYESLYLNGEHWWIDFEHNPEVFEMLSEKHKEHAVINPADEIALEVIEYTKKAQEFEKVWMSSTEIGNNFKLSNTGRKNISIIKKNLLEEGIEFNTKTKKFKVCISDKTKNIPSSEDNEYM